MSDLTAFKALIANITPGDLTAIITIFSYQGFNPEMVMKHLLEIKQSASISDQDFNTDLVALLCLGVISGNYTSKNQKKRDEKGTKMADDLYAKYKLKMGSIGADKKAVTLPRVLLTFPLLTSKVSLMCPEKNYPGPFNSSILPHSMKNPVFPALIPASAEKKTRDLLMLVFCCYTSDQSMAINDTMKTMPPADVFKKQMEYVEIGFKSPEPPQSDRDSYFRLVLKATIAKGADDILKVAEKYKNIVDNSYVVPNKRDMV